MSQDLKKIVGVRIRAARKAEGLTQAALAEAVDRTEEAISNIERGRSLPKLELLVRLCEVLQTSLSELVEIDIARCADPQRAELEAALFARIARLPIDRLRIAARQIEGLFD
jgi:transcriptional regulator with XRE-family HTH domain